MAERRKLKYVRPMRLLTISAALLTFGLGLHFISSSLLTDVLSAVSIGGAWIMPVLLVVWRNTHTSLATKTQIQNMEQTVVRRVEEARAKGSRHEYHQERSLERIEGDVRRLSTLLNSAAAAPGAADIDVLFVTSNGAGLGHISRLIAIANHLPRARTVEFLTMSTAYRQLENTGIAISYFPSSEAVRESPARWNPVFRAYLLSKVKHKRPRVVVFDGTWVYTGITDVCRTLGIPLIWVQRGMWKSEIDAASVQRHNAKSAADHVIIPGDFAGPEEVDVGRDIVPHYVGPIVMTGRDKLLSRENACEALGLDAAKQYVLLNLGGGSIGDTASIANEALRLLHSLTPHLTPVQVVSPLMGEVEEVPGLTRISAYPVMPFVRAFDFVISAAGYNSAQEAVSLGVPSILVPNLDTRTDDQVRRAQQLALQGLCLAVDKPEDLGLAILSLADEGQRSSVSEKLMKMAEPRGAVDAAGILESIIDQEEWVLLATTLRGGVDQDGR